MSKFTKKETIIGIDISKDTLDLSLLCASTYGKFEDKQVLNKFSGFEEILRWLKKKKLNLEDCLFCMEHTGTYGLLLFAWLSQIEADFVVESGLQIKRSIGITRIKNDKLDARKIADYAFIHRAKLKGFEMPSTLLIQVKQLLTYRDQLVRMSTSFKNSLQSHRQYQRVSGLDSVTAEITEQLEDLKKRITALEKQIVSVIYSDPELKKNFQLAKSVKGVGLIITAFMLVTTNNFTAFTDGRKYACYAGIAPFEHSSGTSINGKRQVSHLANKKIKTLLSNGASSAITHDPEINYYYKRKVAEGKANKVIINAIECKLVNRVFAVIKRQTPYVNTYQQNFI